MSHNIKLHNKQLSTFNSRLFIIGGKEIRSIKGTTQGNPTLTGAYALNITPLIQFLHEFSMKSPLLIILQ